MCRFPPAPQKTNPFGSPSSELSQPGTKEESHLRQQKSQCYKKPYKGWIRGTSLPRTQPSPSPNPSCGMRAVMLAAPPSSSHRKNPAPAAGTRDSGDRGSTEGRVYGPASPSRRGGFKVHPFLLTSRLWHRSPAAAGAPDGVSLLVFCGEEAAREVGGGRPHPSRLFLSAEAVPIRRGRPHPSRPSPSIEAVLICRGRPCPLPPLHQRRASLQPGNPFLCFPPPPKSQDLCLPTHNQPQIPAIKAAQPPKSQSEGDLCLLLAFFPQQGDNDPGSAPCSSGEG